MALSSLEVDPELRPEHVTRSLRVDGTDIIACVERMAMPVAGTGELTLHFTHDLAFDQGLLLRRDFRAAEPRLLRVSVSGFLDMVGVVARTLQEFGS